MKVKELIEILRRYDREAEVMVTWEGTAGGIDPEDIYVVPDGNVFIDGDSGFYKKRFGGVSR